MGNSLFVDVHILQTVPPNNINRDDTGSPKSARFGGVKRARVSSQAWKKATRDLFPEYLDTDALGIRTKHVVRLVAQKALNLEPSLDESYAWDKAKEVFTSYCKRGKNAPKFENADPYQLKAIHFTSLPEIDSLARCVVGMEDIDEFKKVAKGKKLARSASRDIVDLAMFGRMVATAPDLNIDASVQVAHAIGIGSMQPEFDYFTALDDLAPEDNAGAAMIETTEFTSATLYRYADVDVLHLRDNIGSTDSAVAALSAFLRAFVMSMPTGKQNSFANRTLPAAVVIQLRNTQPVSLVNAFETPVEAKNGRSQIAIGCERLADQEKAIDSAFGMFPEKSFIVIGSSDANTLLDAMPEAVACNLEMAVKGVTDACADYLEAHDRQLEEEG